MKEVGKMKKWFKAFIERLGKSNEKNFGAGKLDCCDLNKIDSKKKA